MEFIVSMSAKSRIYHKKNCCYAKRITTANKISVGIKSLSGSGYRQCKCCGGVSGFVKYNNGELKQTDILFDYSYDKRTDTLYMRTDVGFWKIFEKEQERYLLYHLNKYDPAMDFERMKNGAFHMQRDASDSDSVGRLINYAKNHDRAKKIIAVDYRNLPRHTKKQKKYYAIAERKARLKSLRRVEELFALIEK